MNSEVMNSNIGNSNTSMLTLLLDAFTSPIRAFHYLYRDPKTKPIFILLILSQMLVAVYFSLQVDTAWLVNQNIISQGPDITPLQRDQIERLSFLIGGNISAIITSVATAIALSIIWALYASFFTVVSTFTADGITFKRWFSLTCWCMAPILLSAVAKVITIFNSSDGRIIRDELNPFTLNNLFFNLPKGEAGASFFNYLNLMVFWSWGLFVIAYKTWTSKSWFVSTLIGLTPSLFAAGVYAVVSYW